MSFLRSLVSRSAVKPVLASRSLSSVAEVKLIGRLTRDVDLLFTQAGNPYAAYTVAVDNPSFNRRGLKGRSDVTSSFYRVTAFYGPIVEKLEQQVHDGQLGKGSLVHAIATMEQQADPKLTRTIPDGRTFPQMQFRFEHKSLDVLLPSTEYRLQKERQEQEYVSSRAQRRDPREEIQPYENYDPDEEEEIAEDGEGEQEVKKETGEQTTQVGEQITESEVASPVVEDTETGKKME